MFLTKMNMPFLLKQKQNLKKELTKFAGPYKSLLLL